MSTRPRHLAIAVAAVALAACGPTALPNFGGLEPDARTLKVKNGRRLAQGPRRQACAGAGRKYREL